MKFNSNDLKEARSDAWSELDILLKKLEEEGTELTSEETDKLIDLKRKIATYDKDIEKALEVEAAQRMKVKRDRANSQKAPEEKAKEAFSWAKFIRQSLDNTLDGAEREMVQEGVNEARSAGVSPQGRALPSMMVQWTRDLSVGTTTEGGHTVETEVRDLIPALRPRLQVEQAGATILTGLRGNISFPRNNGVGSSNWTAEKAAATETTQTFDVVSMSPKRCSAWSEYTLELLNQSTIGVDRFVQSDLNLANQIAVDYGALNGSGSSNQMLGLLNQSGIGDVAGGTNGANPTFDHIVDLETEIAVDNADMGALAYMTTPGVRGYLKKSKIDAGSGIFIWPTNATELNGYRTLISTQVPSDLTKGTLTTGNAIIFGNWRDLILGNWGGLDVIVDRYTKGKEAMVQVITHSWWDTAVRHPESFAAMQDADLT